MMLIDFSLSNFKSFDYVEDVSKQTISMLPSSIRSKSNHISSADLLKTAAIFGGNSSGKSSLFDAVKLIKSIITNKRELKNSLSPLYCTNHAENDSKLSEFRFHFLITHRSSEILFLSDYLAEDSLFDRYREEFVYDIVLKLGFGDDYEIVSESLNRVYGDMTELVCSWSYYDDSNYYHLQKEIMEAAREIEDYSFKNSDFNDLYQYYIVEQRLGRINDELALLGTDVPDNEVLKTKLFDEIVELQNAKEILINILKTGKKDEKFSINLGYQLNRYQDLVAELSLSTHDETKNSMISVDPHVDSLISDYGLKLGVFGNNEVREMLTDVYSWFNQTLEIVDPHKFLLPNINSNSFIQLSGLIKEFDVNISGLEWIPFEDYDVINDIVFTLPESDQDLLLVCRDMSKTAPVECSMLVSDLSGLYLFSFVSGWPVVKKLMTNHFNDPDKHEIFEESNGTRRLIELASILVNQNVDKVYLVDELDCRLHPLVSRHFIERFYELTENSDVDKQLLITTHESRLMTTDLFRLDEIWLLDRKEDGCSRIHNASDSMKVPYHKRLDKMYFDDKVMGGVPNIN